MVTPHPAGTKDRPQPSRQGQEKTQAGEGPRHSGLHRKGESEARTPRQRENRGGGRHPSLQPGGGPETQHRGRLIFSLARGQHRELSLEKDATLPSLTAQGSLLGPLIPEAAEVLADHTPACAPSCPLLLIRGSCHGQAGHRYSEQAKTSLQTGWPHGNSENQHPSTAMEPRPCSQLLQLQGPEPGDPCEPPKPHGVWQGVPRAHGEAPGRAH